MQKTSKPKLPKTEDEVAFQQVVNGHSIKGMNDTVCAMLKLCPYSMSRKNTLVDFFQSEQDGHTVTLRTKMLLLI